MLKSFAQENFERNGYTLNAANEIEGFLFDGIDAERSFHETGKFEYVNPAAITTRCPATRCASSSTPTAEVQRAMGFRK